MTQREVAERMASPNNNFTSHAPSHVKGADLRLRRCEKVADSHSDAFNTSVVINNFKKRVLTVPDFFHPFSRPGCVRHGVAVKLFLRDP